MRACVSVRGIALAGESLSAGRSARMSVPPLVDKSSLLTVPLFYSPASRGDVGRASDVSRAGHGQRTACTGSGADTLQETQRRLGLRQGEVSGGI